MINALEVLASCIVFLIAMTCMSGCEFYVGTHYYGQSAIRNVDYTQTEGSIHGNPVKKIAERY